MIDNDGAGTMWGHALIDRLTAGDAPDKDKVLALARRYHVATPDISFIVLENGAAYARARCRAAQDRAQGGMGRLYRVARPAGGDAAHDKANRLTEVADMWAEEKVWWDQPAVSLKDAARGYKRNRGDGGEDDVAGVPPPPVAQSAPQAEMSLPPPPPPPPPPPMIMAPAEAAPPSPRELADGPSMVGATGSSGDDEQGRCHGHAQHRRQARG